MSNLSSLIDGEQLEVFRVYSDRALEALEQLPPGHQLLVLAVAMAKVLEMTFDCHYYDAHEKLQKTLDTLIAEGEEAVRLSLSA